MQVTDAANNSGTKALSIAVAAAAQPPTVTTTSLPGGTAGTAYSTTLQASGGTTPYSWSVSAGTLPAGLSLAASTGVISGDADRCGDGIVHGAGEGRSEQHGDEGIEYRGGGSSTATHGHDDVTARRDGRHSVFNDTAGEWWNDALQLECERGHAASRIKFGGIDGSDLGDADRCGDGIVHGASDRCSE